MNHLAKMKTPKPLNISNKRVRNLRERKLKSNGPNSVKNKQEKYAKNVHVSFPMSSVEFFYVIG